MPKIRFCDMEKKFGAAAAYHCLLEIEKAACIDSSLMLDVDLEIRLKNACQAQDEMFAAQAQAA